MAEATLEEVSVIGFKGGQAGVEQLAFRDDDDVEAWRDVVTAENLSYQSFSSISLHRAAKFLGRRNAQTADILLVRQDEYRDVPAVRPRTPIVDPPELRAAANTLLGAKLHSAGRYSVDTVSRFRPFARRRFSTSRPFFVLIRTRKPCVRLRRRVLG